jgi:hypothetical protein
MHWGSWNLTPSSAKICGFKRDRPLAGRPFRAKHVRCGEPDDPRAELETGIPLQDPGLDGADWGWAGQGLSGR